MRLKRPHRLVLMADCLGALSSSLEFLHALPPPRFGLLVFKIYPVVELAGKPANCRSIARIGKAKSRCGKAANMFVRRDDDRNKAHVLHLDRRYYGRRRTTVDHNI